MQDDLAPGSSVHSAVSLKRSENGPRTDAEQQAYLFRALHALGVATANAKDAPALAQMVVQHACALTSADVGKLYLWDAERGRLISPLQDEKQSEVLANEVPPSPGASWQAFIQREPIVVADYARRAGPVPMVRGAGVRTVVSIPLILAERVLGCLTLGFSAPGACDDRMVGHLQLLATQVAPLFETLRLLEACRQSEQALQDLNATLEATVSELEAFSYSVSHDLRAPLRAISSYSQILLKDYQANLPADAQDCLQRVNSGAQRMGQLIDALLQFARLGRHVLTRSSVSMTHLAQEAIDDYTDERIGRVIDFQVEDLPSCDGDYGLLRQVFANLIDNAVKYTRSQPEAHVQVGSHLHLDEIVYSVKDNGVGFDMRYADKLFGVFQRLHRSPDYEGTGVGLANVQRIIHRHGGRVWGEASVDGGASFYFTIGKDTQKDG